MKIRQAHLQRIIREELENMSEAGWNSTDDTASSFADKKRARIKGVIRQALAGKAFGPGGEGMSWALAMEEAGLDVERLVLILAGDIELDSNYK